MAATRRPLRARTHRRLSIDACADLRELRRRRVGAREIDRLGRHPRAVRKVAKLGAHRARVGRVDELQLERRARHHLLAEREDVGAHDAVEERRLAGRLRADDDEARHLRLLELAGGADELARGEDAVKRLPPS